MFNKTLLLSYSQQHLIDFKYFILACFFLDESIMTPLSWHVHLNWIVQQIALKTHSKPKPHLFKDKYISQNICTALYDLPESKQYNRTVNGMLWFYGTLLWLKTEMTCVMFFEPHAHQSWHLMSRGYAWAQTRRGVLEGDSEHNTCFPAWDRKSTRLNSSHL